MTPPTATPDARGLRLADGPAHQLDHVNSSRRGFLRSLGKVAAGTCLVNHLPVRALGFSPLAAALDRADEDRVLVFVRLKGGNDGLNTFIPIHDFGTYHAARPDIFVPRAETVALTDTLVMNPRLKKLRALWRDGQMRVVQNVGYPDQSLSHFRSSDIWATTSDADQIEGSGVLGRYLSDQYPDFLSTPPEWPPAIQIGGAGNLLFNNEEDFNYAISTENPSQLYNIARNGQLYDVGAVPDCSYGEQLGYLRAVANTTFRYAGVLARTFEAGSSDADYLDDRLGQQLSLVARMLVGGLRTRLFVVEIDGFDTHANQLDSHPYLLESLATNVTAFFSDLRRRQLDQRVLAMTFSEFGRRLHQNGSRGTDHGAAAPVMLFGPGLEGSGVAGGLPDLRELDEDYNLIHRVDFRAVYATVLSRWLCIDPGAVDAFMGGTFPRLNELGLSCEGTTATPATNARSGISLNVHLSGGEVIITYALPAAARVTLHFFDAAGRRLGSPLSERRASGRHTERLSLGDVGWSSGVYVVGLETNGRMYSRKLGLFGARS